MESKSYVCAKCGRVCHFCLHSKVEATEQLCSQCYSEAHAQKEPFNFEHHEPISPDAFGGMDEVPDDVRKVEPKSVHNIDELLNDLAKKRSMRDTVNNIYSRGELFPKAQHCALCEHELDDGICLKTATGAIICEDCHYKLYYEPNQSLREDNLKSSWDMCPRCQSKDFKHFDGMIICNKCGRMDREYLYDPVKHVIYRVDANGNPTLDTTKEPAKPVKVEARYDLIPQRALRAIAIAMGEGAIEYGVDNWRTKTDFAENMNRAAQHWNLALLGDTEHEASVKDHLSHCIARMCMAYETYKEVSE